jgi:hypothetical protein
LLNLIFVKSNKKKFKITMMMGTNHSALHNKQFDPNVVSHTAQSNYSFNGNGMQTNGTVDTSLHGSGKMGMGSVASASMHMS